MSFFSLILARSQCRSRFSFLLNSSSSKIWTCNHPGRLFSLSPSSSSACHSTTSNEQIVPLAGRQHHLLLRPHVLTQAALTTATTPVVAIYNIGFHSRSRHFSTAQILFKDDEIKPSEDEVPKKTGIVAKFKQMCRDYWYILVPVHAATSVIWFGSFYILCKSGIDVTALLSSFGVSQVYLEKIAHSEWSYVALAMACYKLASPLRYTATVGASTLTIKYLKDWGYLKTSGEVAKEFRDKMDVGKDKMKEEWERYSERRRGRKRAKRGAKKNSKQ